MNYFMEATKEDITPFSIMKVVNQITTKLEGKLRLGVIKTKEQFNSLLKVEIELQTSPYLYGGDATMIKSQIEQKVQKKFNK